RTGHCRSTASPTPPGKSSVRFPRRCRSCRLRTSAPPTVTCALPRREPRAPHRAYDGQRRPKALPCPGPISWSQKSSARAVTLEVRSHRDRHPRTSERKPRTTVGLGQAWRFSARVDVRGPSGVGAQQILRNRVEQPATKVPLPGRNATTPQTRRGRRRGDPFVHPKTVLEIPARSVTDADVHHARLHVAARVDAGDRETDDVTGAQL